MSRVVRRVLAGLLVGTLLLAAVVVLLNLRGEERIDEGATPAPASAEQIARGAYLARAGNCMTCHTARGGAPYAGGRAIETPFGPLYGPNLTPDAQTGIGTWTAGHFWRALHNGRSRDGRLLYPAFPYFNYTHVSREDSDALFAYLRSLPPVQQRNREHGLRFPYDTQAALALWRALFFQPRSFVPEPARSAEWNRGAYLVQGLGHCSACHASRNLFGASQGSLDLSGGLIPMRNWYAPSLNAAREAGVAHWDLEQIVRLMKSGVSDHGSVTGPMAEVVLGSTQHLSDADLRAMATYLKALPQRAEPPAADKPPVPEPAGPGAKLYEQHCAQCHGADGEGVKNAYPPLAGNRAVLLDPPANLVRIVHSGGFPPATAGNPRPFGMPPYATVLNTDEIAAVVSYVRWAWGNQGEPVSAFQVNEYVGKGRQ